MGNAYTPSALRELEPMVYKVGVQQLVNRLYQHADNEDTIDLMVLFKYMTLVSICHHHYHPIFIDTCHYSRMLLAK